jgi:membrane-bound lytic murein transglycosylase B
MTPAMEPLKGMLTAAVVIAAVLLRGGGADAQTTGGISNLFGNIFSGQNSATPAQAQTAPNSSAAPLPWSGEDGASGHPLMTASAIREAAANFDNCVASMWPDAARRNLSRESFERFTGG